MGQRLVVWNAHDEIRADSPGDVQVIDLTHGNPKLAAAIGRGRIVSHDFTHRGSGRTFTFVVED